MITVADAESELAGAVVEGGFGLNIPPGRPQEVADVLDEIAKDRSAARGVWRGGKSLCAAVRERRVFESFLAELERVAAQ